MLPESRKFLFDIRAAIDLLLQFTDGRTYEEYSQDAMLRAAVERQFEIVGEGINQLARIDPETASKITEFQRIISFRNILIHGYAHVDDRIVWGMIESRLPRLAREVVALFPDAAD